MNKIINIWFSIFLGLSGCDDCQYTIKKDYIESTCAFTQGFVFAELRVFSFEDGFPDSVEIARSVSLALIKENLAPRKKIFFYRENKNYEWIDTKNQKLVSILPIKMEVGKWYEIYGLVYMGNPDRAAYITLNQKGELEVYGYIVSPGRPRPWGKRKHD